MGLGLAPGVVLVTGENGAGKTNLLEALHLGTQGFSPRTRSESRLVRFGASVAAIGLHVRRGDVEHHVRLRIASGQGKTVELDGSPIASAESLRREFPTLVFTPDRLAVVKGGPAARRAYFDRVVGRLLPARAGVPQEYGSAVAQRNAALRRVQLGLTGRGSLEPWTARVAELGQFLVEARRETIDLLSPGFERHLAELGLDAGRLLYDAEPPTRSALEARLEADLARGATGLGPHLDDVGIEAAGRDLRSFGSQGEQRLALLALVLSETTVLPSSPLLLLDDVLSELDARRRLVLADRVAGVDQTVITATHRSALPCEPSQLVEVTAGHAV